MKKKIILLAIASAMAFSAVACTGGKQTQETTAPETTVYVNDWDKPTSKAETTTKIEETTEKETEPETAAPETEPEPEIEKPAENTSEMVDYLSDKAREDAKTATDDDIQTAVEWLKENKYNYFSGNENMEQTMYYGYLLEYKNLNTGNDYERVGFQASKTVKYVYRGYETVLDTSTHNNLKKLQEMVDNL